GTAMRASLESPQGAEPHGSYSPARSGGIAPLQRVGQALASQHVEAASLAAPVTFVTALSPSSSYPASSAPAPAPARQWLPDPSWPAPVRGGMGAASVTPYSPFTQRDANAGVAPAPDPDVWLIALATAGGGLRPLEGAGRAGAIRVSRPYGHLRSIRPVLPEGSLGTASVVGGMNSGPFTGSLSGKLMGAVVTGALVGASAQIGADSSAAPKRGRASGGRRKADTTQTGLGSAEVGKATFAGSLSGLSGGLIASGASASRRNTVAERPLPQVISAVEIETDAGIFRVERPDSVLGHSDIAWSLAHMEAGEPDSTVPLPRRYLALLLTLLPTPEDPEHPEEDRTWGWAHRLRGPWERGPLHPKGKLGRLIAIDPDESGQGMHRACFELLGSEEVVWGLGVPCFRAGSVYELTPLSKHSLSRWLTWPLNKGRRRAGAAERPDWEIARVVYRVGAPRWPLAGVVEPLGPIGVAG
ncbi:MAG: hypothetical protein ABI068_10425, partial [Ktedonobacterales bacterium]